MSKIRSYTITISDPARSEFGDLPFGLVAFYRSLVDHTRNLPGRHLDILGVALRSRLEQTDVLDLVFAAKRAGLIDVIPVGESAS